MASPSLPIEVLAKTFSGDIVAPDHAEYRASLARWAANAQRDAALVTFPKSAADIAEVLSFARENKTPIAVRGGGHSASGASSIENGIVIDLSRYFNTARIDVENKLAYVGGGAIWETVDKAAIEHGLATVGGTVNHTGVGGLVLGGGYGWLSAQHGLVIDNLVKATVVTANGSILTASNEENTDLFWAIRGGGGNFGVITEFVLKLYPQRRTVYAGPLIFHGSALEKIVENLQAWYPNASEKEGVIMGTTFSPESGQPIVLLILFYNGSEEEGKETFKRFFDLGPLVVLAREIPYETLNTLQNAQASHGKGVYMKGLGHKKIVFEGIAAAHTKVVEAIKTDGFKAAAVLYEFFPLHKVNTVAVEETAFRRLGIPGILLMFNWDNSASNRSNEARKHAYDIANTILGAQGDVSESERLGYSNYDTEAVVSDSGVSEAEKSVRAVFGPNYPRLQEVKKKYDPESVFNRWFAITPAA